MGGDHYTGYYNAAAHSAEVGLPLSTWEPSSGTDINCENCHKPHGSDASRLTALRLGTEASEQNLCYGEGNACHGTGTANTWKASFWPCTWPRTAP